MLSVFLWTGILLFTLHRTNSSLGKIDGKTGFVHAFLLWIFLMSFSTSFKMLGWAFGHTSDIKKYFYIPVGPIPDWFNLIMWAAFLVFGIAAMLLTFELAKRKEKYRKIFVKLLPIFYLLSVYEFAKSFYLAGSTEDASILLAVSIGLLVFAIPFGSMFYFYSKESVKEKIFAE
ncbi:MAG: hypothetical protein PHV08_01535 [Sulfurovaceae bacterium]|nr:hypothetical protein [Sulfurovaceae bacterium]